MSAGSVDSAAAPQVGVAMTCWARNKGIPKKVLVFEVKGHPTAVRVVEGWVLERHMGLTVAAGIHTDTTSQQS